eukprot:XP_019924376.1 PREDICTED: lysozyme [Crassostrea gigas]
MQRLLGSIVILATVFTFCEGMSFVFLIQTTKGFKACANDYTCASNCVRAYMKRYIGSSGCPANCESYARIHNGGPRGCRYPSTLRYWEKVHQQGCNVNS